MAIKVNGNTVIDNNKRGAFQVLNPGASAANPSAPSVGDFYYDTAEEKILTWTGTEWK